jgi:starvation-inducible DNA-binding protein
MFTAQYTELWNPVDPIAGRVRALCYPAIGSLADFAKASTLQDAPAHPPKA